MTEQELDKEFAGFIKDLEKKVSKQRNKLIVYLIVLLTLTFGLGVLVGTAI